MEGGGASRGDAFAGPFSALADDARRLAGTTGRDQAGLIHLAAAASAAHPAAFEDYFGIGAPEAVRRAIEDGGTPADLDHVLRSVADRGATLPHLFEAIGAEVERAVEGIEGSARLPPSVDHLAEVVAPDRTIIGFDGAIDEVLARIGRQLTLPVLVSGPAGSGKTALLAALAARLADPGYDGPACGSQVVRIPAERLLVDDAASELRDAVHALVRTDGPFVLAIDDLEVAAWLDAPGGANQQLLRTLRAEVGLAALPMIVLADDRYVTRLGVHAPELADELYEVRVPVLTPDELKIVARAEADALERHHGVSIPDETVRAASGRRTRADRLTHPGLLVRRLDGACTRARLSEREQVSRRDLALAAPDPDDPAAADSLAERLARRVLHQPDAIQTVTRRLAITRRLLDIAPHRPDGVFLLAGPSGVGKTALARALAAEFFHDERKLLVLDMSEYAQEWAVSRLTGPQPGYAGSREPETWLTTRIRQQPDCVLVLDEIDKAHPTILDTLLQVFDGGRLTDSRGTTADFGRTVILMTTNWGADELAGTPVGFGADPSPDAQDAVAAATHAIESHLRPELVSRMDALIVFRPLTEDAIAAIARRECRQLAARLAHAGYDLAIPDEVADVVAQRGYDRSAGARHLQRAIERELVEPLAELDEGAFDAVLDGDTVRWQARVG